MIKGEVQLNFRGIKLLLRESRPVNELYPLIKAAVQRCP